MLKYKNETIGIGVADLTEVDEKLKEITEFPSGEGFYLDEKEGVRGYNTDPERGADTFHPFLKPEGTATAEDVVSGKTFSNADGVGIEGSLKSASSIVEPTKHTMLKGQGTYGSSYAPGYTTVFPEALDLSTHFDNSGKVIMDYPTSFEGSPSYTPKICKSYTEGTVSLISDFGTVYTGNVVASDASFGKEIVKNITPKGMYKDRVFAFYDTPADKLITHDITPKGNIALRLNVDVTTLKLSASIDGGETWVDNTTNLLTHVSGQGVEISVYVITPTDYIIIFNTYKDSYRQIVYMNRATVNARTGVITLGTSINICPADTSTTDYAFTLMKSFELDWYFMVLRADTTISTGAITWYYNLVNMNPNTAGNIALGSSSWTKIGADSAYYLNIPISQYAFARGSSSNMAFSPYYAYIERVSLTDDSVTAYSLYWATVNTGTPTYEKNPSLGVPSTRVTGYDRGTGIAICESTYLKDTRPTAGTFSSIFKIWNLSTKTLEDAGLNKSIADGLSVAKSMRYYSQKYIVQYTNELVIYNLPQIIKLFND